MLCDIFELFFFISHIDWLIDWLIDVLMYVSIDWLIDWWVDWCIDVCIDWLIDWLIGWLIDWLVVYTFLLFLVIDFSYFFLWCYFIVLGLVNGQRRRFWKLSTACLGLHVWDDRCHGLQSGMGNGEDWLNYFFLRSCLFSPHFFVLVDATFNHKPVALGRGGIFVVSNECLGWKNSRVSILVPGVSVDETRSIIVIDHYLSSQRWQCPSHSDCQCVDHDADFSQTVLSTHRVDVVRSLGAVVRKTPWTYGCGAFSVSKHFFSLQSIGCVLFLTNGFFVSFSDKALSMIAASLPVAKLGDPASWALQELSQFCRSHLTQYFHQLMGLLTGLEGQELHEDEMESVSKGTMPFLLRRSS